MFLSLVVTLFPKTQENSVSSHLLIHTSHHLLHQPGTKTVVDSSSGWIFSTDVDVLLLMQTFSADVVVFPHLQLIKEIQAVHMLKTVTSY